MSVFVDRVKISAQAGNGGDGCVSFHREKYIQHGGPDGGNGGKGGNVIFYADPNMHTLLDFRFHTKFVAASGENGEANMRTGKSGSDLIIKVPVGTVVTQIDTNLSVADLSEPGKEVILLHGGRGGYGNSNFATPTRQAPNFAKPGIKTNLIEFRLELKTIADVGLIGFPNVGKSTLLAALTSAKPKIANYHFTTLTPNLGIVKQYDETCVLADIPGLVEGASEGIGLGHYFLRHVERTRLLLHIVDASGCEGRDPISDFEIINNELDNYGDLKSRPQIIVLNKCDLIFEDEQLDKLKEEFKTRGFEVCCISAAAHTGLTELVNKVFVELKNLPPIIKFQPESEVAERRTDEPFTIQNTKDGFIVSGFSIENLISSVNFGDEESLNWFHQKLRTIGVINALRKLGAKEGDTVIIKNMAFDFVE